MTLSELLKGCNEALQAVFSIEKYGYYGVDIVEGYTAPCFFVQIKPTTTPVNRYIRNNEVTLYINYFQSQVDEVDLLEKADKINQIFDKSVKIGDRYVHVEDVSFDYVGKDRNILQATIELQYHTAIKQDTTQPLMTEVSMRYDKEE
jgi:hypothetical protein|nr:MAG TPA: tail completion protein [Caudoviricetes sp.]